MHVYYIKLCYDNGRLVTYQDVTQEVSDTITHAVHVSNQYHQNMLLFQQNEDKLKKQISDLRESLRLIEFPNNTGAFNDRNNT